MQVSAELLSGQEKKKTHGASLDNTSQKEEWVEKIKTFVGREGVLVLVFTSHH